MTRRVVAVLMTVMACAGGAARATDVTANILTDTTWTVAGSPWVIKRNVQVRLGATLTIEPGATVAFDGFYRLETDNTKPAPSIVALGTDDNRITFTSNLPSPTVGSWNMVAVVDTSSSSAFRHCVFEYATEGLRVIAGDAPIERCSFSNCQTGIYLQYSKPSITGTSIVNCTVAGIQCQFKSTRPEIHDCYLDNRSGGAYNVRLANYDGGGFVYINAEYNWWGTSVEFGDQGIRASIWDNVDDVNIKGVVIYTPWYTEPAVETTSWGAIKALFKG